MPTSPSYARSVRTRTGIQRRRCRVSPVTPPKPRPPAPASQLVGQRLVGGGESQRHAVDAVTLAGRGRAVGEDVALVPAAARADDLVADHAVAGVADRGQVAFGDRRGEARPARPAVELLARAEQRQPAQPAGVDALPLVIGEDAAERRLGAMLEQDVALLARQVGCKPFEFGFGRRGEVETGHGDPSGLSPRWWAARSISSMKTGATLTGRAQIPLRRA